MMIMDATAADHIAVAETCTAMGWYADRRQWDQLLALFAEEVLVDYTSLNGGEPARLPPGDLVGSWRRTLGALAATQHLVANPMVTLNPDDTAVCVANFQATHAGTAGGQPALWTLGGHYRFALARQSESWRITEVTMTVAWETGTRAVLEV
jgi:3-phenylpropionate/cinnamic acid dioxygenase small subunit